MKSLHEHISEKLIINKNFKGVDALLGFIHSEKDPHILIFNFFMKYPSMMGTMPQFWLKLRLIKHVKCSKHIGDSEKYCIYGDEYPKNIDYYNSFEIRDNIGYTNFDKWGMSMAIIIDNETVKLIFPLFDKLKSDPIFKVKDIFSALELDDIYEHVNTNRANRYFDFKQQYELENGKDINGIKKEIKNYLHIYDDDEYYY